MIARLIGVVVVCCVLAPFFLLPVHEELPLWNTPECKIASEQWIARFVPVCRFATL